MNPSTAIAGVSDRERDPNYRAVVAILSGSWRVIACRDGLQWIIQRRDGESAGQARWTGVHYCTTRNALIRLCRALEPLSDPGALHDLCHLPRHFRSQT